VLVDACRDQPKDSGQGSQGVQGRVLALPEDAAVLFSCRAGQQSFESEQAGGGHGLFTYCLLEGLWEKLQKDGQVTWSGLVSWPEGQLGGFQAHLSGEARFRCARRLCCSASSNCQAVSGNGPLPRVQAAALGRARTAGDQLPSPAGPSDASTPNGGTEAGEPSLALSSQAAGNLCEADDLSATGMLGFRGEGMAAAGGTAQFTPGPDLPPSPAAPRSPVTAACWEK
jgi:hypothetical protein